MDSATNKTLANDDEQSQYNIALPSVYVVEWLMMLEGKHIYFKCNNIYQLWFNFQFVLIMNRILGEYRQNKIGVKRK